MPDDAKSPPAVVEQTTTTTNANAQQPGIAVTNINALSSQVWAAFLVIAGTALFGVACLCHTQDVRAAIISAGTMLMGGGVGMFQHKASPPSN